MTARFTTQLLTSADDLTAVLRLRRQVFVAEMGAYGAQAESGDQDRFDDYSTHLAVLDRARAAGDQIVGVYRFMDNEAAARAGGFYCDAEYDLRAITSGGTRVLELGRSCLHPDYRGGIAMFHLWDALKAQILAKGVDILFGVASFPGTDIEALEQPLALLHHDYLAPADMRPVSKIHEPMNRIPPAQIDRKRAMLQMPALIKAYLRMGGRVGEGAFIDHAFNTVDICMILQTAAIADKKVPMR